MKRQHIAIKDPVRLYAEPLGLPELDGNRWMLVAEDTEGNRLTIVASGGRFNDAFHHPARRHSHAEQARQMFLRDEISVETFERAL